jgi:integrase
MLGVLPEPARTICAVAAFTGLRRGELRGLKPEDLDGQLLIVRRSVWRQNVGAPKGKRGTGAVPVIEPLAGMLEQYLLEFGPKTFLFESMSGGPVSIEYITREVIGPTLRKVGMEWHGWHAFRRGLATNLYALGVPDTVIQAILRHSNVAVTRQSYIKHTGVDERSVAAMKALESQICTKHAPGSGI